jgi:hypothetical protein
MRTDPVHDVVFELAPKIVNDFQARGTVMNFRLKGETTYYNKQLAPFTDEQAVEWLLEFGSPAGKRKAKAWLQWKAAKDQSVG